MKKYNITKQFLIQEYNKKSTTEIAKKVGCSQMTIIFRMIGYNIPRRTVFESHKKGKNHLMYNPERHKKHYCKEPNCNNVICYHTWKHGQGRCKSCAITIVNNKRWKDEKWREKTIKSIIDSFNFKPNKIELRLYRLLQNILFKEYKFVGDGKVIIGGFCPDFVNCNGQKKIIELYGDYWHNRKDWTKRDKRRLIAYNKHGYQTLVIWEHEFKNLDKVKEKVLEFHHGRII